MNDTPSVLVVEDDPDVREALCDALEDEGLRVRSAVHGLQALHHLREHYGRGEPVVVLLDLMMPIMSGQEFLRAFRQHLTEPNLRVVVVTAAPPADFELITAAAHAVLRKPFEIDQLVATIRAQWAKLTKARNSFGSAP